MGRRPPGTGPGMAPPLPGRPPGAGPAGGWYAPRVTFARTKIQPPRPRSAYVARGGLEAKLAAALLGRRAVLVSAPAGYGKTTVLASWARQTNAPTAWLSLGPEVDDPERFLRYLLKAWEHVQPGVAELPAGVLLSGMMPELETVLGAFIDTATRLDAPVIFVLDDYHALGDPGPPRPVIHQ